MTYSTAVTPQSTVDKVLDYVIADAREALGLLETDPLFLADSLEAYTYRNDRSYRFNYYAVAATLARAYQWKGGADNLAQALVYARKVIEEKKFSWVHYTSITSSNAYERDLLFASELLFRLNVLDMDDIIGPYFKEQTDKTKNCLLPRKCGTIFTKFRLKRMGRIGGILIIGLIVAVILICLNSGSMKTVHIKILCLFCVGPKCIISLPKLH